MDDFTLSLLSNDEVLAIDQDPLAQPAHKVSVQGDLQVWSKPLADGSTAVGIFNLGAQASGATLSFSDLGLTGNQSIRDCWRQKDLGAFQGSFTPGAAIPAHGVLLLRLKGQ